MVCSKLSDGNCELDNKICDQKFTTKMGIKKCRKLVGSKKKSGLKKKIKAKVSKLRKKAKPKKKISRKKKK